MGWKEQEGGGNRIKWNQAKVIEGEYLGGELKKTTIGGKDGQNTLHRINVGGEEMEFWGTTQINDALGDVPVGAMVRIEYSGQQTKTPQGYLKEFKVYVWEEDTDKPGTEPESANPASDGPPFTLQSHPPASPAPQSPPAPSQVLPSVPPVPTGGIPALQAQCREFITVLKLGDQRVKDLWRQVGSKEGTEGDWKRFFVVLYNMNHGATPGAAVLSALQAYKKDAPARDDEVPF